MRTHARRLPIAALLTAAAGGIHLAAAVPHFTDDRLLGASFVAVGWLQLAVAAGLLLGVSRSTVAAATAVNLVAAAAWALSRTTGLPLGHAGPEAVGIADLVTVAFEVAAMGLLVARWRGSAALLGSRTTAVVTLAATGILVGIGSGAAIATLATGHHHAVAPAAHSEPAGGHAAGPADGAPMATGDETEAAETPDPPVPTPTQHELTTPSPTLQPSTAHDDHDDHDGHDHDH